MSFWYLGRYINISFYQKLHNTACSAVQWIALHCGLSVAERMTDITQVVTKTALSQRKQISRDCNQTFMEDKTDAQTRKQRICFSRAFVFQPCGYNFDVVEIYWIEIYYLAYQSIDRKVLCSYLLVELHRSKLELGFSNIQYSQLADKILHN